MGGDRVKIKLSVSKEHYQEIKTALEAHGIEINENADLVLSEKNCYIDNLIVKNTRNGKRTKSSRYPSTGIKSGIKSTGERA